MKQPSKKSRRTAAGTRVVKSPAARSTSPLSVVICAFNGLEYTKLLLESLRRHSTYEHEIVVWSDGSTDGTAAWLEGQAGLIAHHDASNRGICSAMNSAARLATRPYLFFPNTDHVLAPGWDEALLRRIGPRTVVSFGCLEPGTVPVASVFHTENLGTRAEEFDWKRFVRAAARLSVAEAVPGVNYPFAIARALWDEVGGLDERFNPGPANDPDLFYRLHFAGAQFLRAADALAYHFSGKSSRMADEASSERREWREVTDRNEARFAEKWGERYRYANGGLPDPGPEAAKRWFGAKTPSPGTSRLRVVFDARGVTEKLDGVASYSVGLLRALRRLPEVDLRVLTNDAAAISRKLEGLRGLSTRLVSARLGDRAAEEHEIGALIEELHPDVYHGPAFSLPPGLRCPAVATIHDLAFEISPEWYPADFVSHMTDVVRDSAARAARLIAVSDRTRDDLVRLLGVDPSRIVRVREAAPESLLARKSAALNEVARRREPTKAFLLAIGMRQRRKNALGLVRAFVKVSDAGAVKDLGLLMTLAADSEEPGFVEETRRLAGERDVVLTDHLAEEDLARALAGAIALVYPSFYEGFGLPVLEAMAFGVPVVCSDGGALPEIAGGAALVVPAGDEVALSTAIERLLRTPELRRDLSLRGPARALEFSWDKAARETLAVYRAAVQAPALRVEEVPRPSASPRRPLRVAVDARMAGAPHTGTGKYTLEFLRHLDGATGDAQIVLIGPNNVEASRFEPWHQIDPGPGTLLNAAWEQFTSVASLAGCDAIFSPTGILPVTRSCAGVTVVHDLAFLDRPNDFEPRLREHLMRWVRLSCLSAARIVAVSEFTRDRIRHHYSIPADLIRVVHHGRPVASAAPPSGPQGRARVLCVSAFVPNKNQAVLLEAFSVAGLPSGSTLTLAGRSGASLTALRDQARSLKLDGAVKIEESPDDRRLEELYRTSTLFAFPSAYEGFGLPLVEAMNAGLPILASRIPPCEEVLGPGAHLVPADDVAAWAGALREIASDSRRAQALANQSLDRVQAFDWRKTVAETWKAVEEAVHLR